MKILFWRIGFCFFPRNHSQNGIFKKLDFFFLQRQKKRGNQKLPKMEGEKRQRFSLLLFLFLLSQKSSVRKMKRSAEGSLDTRDPKIAKMEEESSGVSGSAFEHRCVNELRCLSADLPSQAKSGHPGAPIGMAPMAYALFSKHMSFNPENPKWPNRDRFILSNGHASALQYSLLHLLGYPLSMADLRAFRQLNSRTPGHPETFTPGVEVATGPLGQGFCNAVGMALSYEHLASTFNKPDIKILDNFIYVFMGDGCNMEGVTGEAASLAGHLGLGRLIVLYDDNLISIAGSTNLAFTEDVPARYRAYGWHTSVVENGDTDLEGLQNAIAEAKIVTDRPSLISVRTTIGYKAPKQGTASIHGAPLSQADLHELKKAFGLEEGTFNLSQDVQAHFKSIGDAGKKKYENWEKTFALYSQKYPIEASELSRRFKGELPQNWQSVLPKFSSSDKAMATRELSGIVLNALAPSMPELMGGSADLGPSTKTDLKCSHNFQKDSKDGRLIQFGVREHAMCAIANGMHAYGALIPYTSTFLVFLTYCIASVRLSALSNHQVIYIFTHDSVLIGEDGPTHQPVEILATARCTPNLQVIRPADGKETVGAYIAAIQKRDGPTLFSLTRHAVPHLSSTSVDGVLKGGYVIHDVQDPKVILVATGSEVSVAFEAGKTLGNARVVSMPCTELFDSQSVEYRESVFLPGVPILSVEAASPMGWEKYAHGHVCITTFGKSANFKDLVNDFGFTPENIVEKANILIKSFEGGSAPILTRRLIFSAGGHLH